MTGRRLFAVPAPAEPGASDEIRRLAEIRDRAAQTAAQLIAVEAKRAEEPGPGGFPVRLAGVGLATLGVFTAAGVGLARFCLV
jgi:hypothetical protein